MSFLFTDPDNFHRSPQSHLLNREKGGNGYVNYKEDVCHALRCFGIPLRPAEVAVIDFRARVIGYFRDKLTPEEAAVLLIDDVRRIYKV